LAGQDVPEAADEIEGDEGLDDQTDDMEDDLAVKLHLDGVFSSLVVSSAEEFNDWLPLVIVEDFHNEAEFGQSQQLEDGSDFSNNRIIFKDVEGERCHKIEVELDTTRIFLSDL